MKLHLRALCRLCILGSAVCTIGLCQTAHAQLPTFVAGRPGVSQAHVGDMAMTYGEQTALERRLAKAVVVVRAQGDSVHPLAQGTRVFDGAAVAISASALTDVIDPEFVASDDTAKPESNHAHSFFDDSYRRSSSPFADKTPPKRESDAMRQYFLTTADWLTGAKKITVALDKRNYEAKLEYCDDAQNVAILSTQRLPNIEPVSIYDFAANDDILPGVAFLLLQPQSTYQQLTQHVFSLQQSHTYATSNHVARNGYPMFTRQGELVGLSVGPAPTHTQASIVHSGLIDRALHPQKYSRTTIEKIELQEK